jgi:hypothetical protein
MMSVFEWARKKEIQSHLARDFVPNLVFDLLSNQLAELCTELIGYLLLQDFHKRGFNLFSPFLLFFLMFANLMSHVLDLK